MQTREALAQLSLIIAETYGRPFSEGMLEIWWQALEVYSDQLVQKAVVRHIQDPDAGSYFPKPADIIRHAIDIRRIERLNTPNALQLAGPKIPPRPWVLKMMDRLATLSKTHAGLPWPAEEARKIFDDAKREQQEPDPVEPAP